jgi:hypothetical protein
MAGLTRERILRALEAIAANLPADRPHTLVVVGGAALVLLHGARDMSGSRSEIWGRVQVHLVPGRESKAQYAFDDLWEASPGTH